MTSLRDNLSRQVETVGEITAHRPYLAFDAGERIENIVREMNNRHQGAVGILDAEHGLIGLLTERDILRKIFGVHGETPAEHEARHQRLSVYPEGLRARDVMTKDPLCLTDDMRVEDALDDISRHGFRFMPVVSRNAERRLSGIVSERELFWHTQEKLRRTVRSQNSLLSYFIQEPYCSANGPYVENEH